MRCKAIAYDLENENVYKIVDTSLRWVSLKEDIWRDKAETLR